MTPFATCLAFVLRPENDGQPMHFSLHDPGGATAWGITFATFVGWCRKNGRPHPSVADLRDISVADRDAIYAEEFWNPLRGDYLPHGVDLMVFDFGVNASPRTSAMALQRALGFTGPDLDGDVGPMTIGATSKFPAFALIAGLADLQEAYYRSLPDFRRFGRDWLARTQRRRSASVAMLGVTATS